MLHLKLKYKCINVNNINFCILNGSRKDQKMLSIVDCLMMENKSLKIELESCHQKVAKSYRVNIIYLFIFNYSRVCNCYDD